MNDPRLINAPRYTPSQIAKMSRQEYQAARADIHQAARDGRIDPDTDGSAPNDAVADRDGLDRPPSRDGVTPKDDPYEGLGGMYDQLREDAAASAQGQASPPDTPDGKPALQTTVVGAPAIQSFTQAQIAAMTPAEYRQNKSAILAAARAGRITDK